MANNFKFISIDKFGNVETRYYDTSVEATEDFMETGEDRNALIGIVFETKGKADPRAFYLTPQENLKIFTPPKNKGDMN